MLPHHVDYYGVAAQVTAMVYLYLIALLFFFIISFPINNYNVIAPQIVFSFSFLFQAVWVILYDELWDLNIGNLTYIVIILGVAIFFISSSVTKIVVSQKKNLIHSKLTCENKVPALKEINISWYIELAYLILMVFFTLIYLKFIVGAVGGSMSSFGQISEAIGEFDRISKFTDSFDVVRVPSILNNGRAFAIASGYWFSYVIINNYICRKKIRIVELSIVMLTAVISVLSGSRTPLFMMLVSAIAYGIMLFQKNPSTKRKEYYKLLLKVTVVGVLFVVSFIAFGTILGRNITRNPLDYLFVYCGAEVKNLDFFLKEIESASRNEIWGSETFKSIVTTIGEKIGFEGYKPYNLDLPFRSYMGNGLGNVYTTFYPYIYDFGFVGLVLLVALMGIISELVFEKANTIANGEIVSISLLAYGTIFGCLILSFFSNKFYETVFSAGFVKNLVFWVVMNIAFSGKIHIRRSRQYW